MKRLLVYFSYIGTNYHGLQRVSQEFAQVPTVQGAIESGLKNIFNKHIDFTVSSRTDVGVHAIETAGQIDLDELPNKFVYSPEKFCQILNSILEMNSTDIRIKRIVEVDPEFHCRHNAVSRHYCYRLAVIKPHEIFDNFNSLTRGTAVLPISHLNRHHQVIYSSFDVQAVAKACELFLGQWNFRTFMESGRQTKDLGNNHRKFTKTLSRFTFSKFNINEVPCALDPEANKFDFYDFNIIGSGFLRKQVRRMVSTLVGVGQGTVSTERIVHMLKNPVEGSWDSTLPAIPGGGLYLKSVNYKNVPILRGPFS